MTTEEKLLLSFIATLLVGINTSFEAAIFLTLWIFIAVKFVQLRKEKKL